jgi:hypothetical protein
MEAEDSLPRYQKTTLQPNSEPHESSLHPLTFKKNFDIIFPKSIGLPRDVLLSGFLTNIWYAFLVPTICSM